MRALEVLRGLNEARHLLSSAIEEGLDEVCIDELRTELDRLETELDSIDARRRYSRRTTW